MRNLRTRVVAALLAALLVPAGVWAQAGSTGAITGTVQDQQGAIIPNAKVTVLNKATGVSVRELTTTSVGTFNVPLLPPGTYRVEITADGFSKFEVNNVLVKVTETVNLVATMRLGAITETVTVSELATTVQTTNPTTGQTISAQTASTLPLSTRNFFSLLTLSSGANTEIFDSAALGRGQVSINVNGQRPTNNNYQLEGINANDVNLPVLDNVALPNPQTIQEFKTQTSLYDASQGRNGGGNIQVALKSGTDKYHGDIYEFFRNDVLNANDFFLNRQGQPRPVLRQNQFGASIGGPVPFTDKVSWLKNFFAFGNYQGTRAVSGLATGTQLSTTMVVLPSNRSAANLQSVFFPGGLPAGFTQLDPVALAFLNLPASKCPGFNDGTFCIPTVPGTPGITGTTVTTGSISRSLAGTYDEDQYTITVDKQITDKDRLAVRWFNDKFSSVQPFGGASTLAHAMTFPQTNRFLKLGWTRVWTSTMVNEARFGFNRFTFARVPTERVLLADVGATRGNSGEFPAAYRINITGSGAFQLGTGVNDDRFGAFNTFYWADDFTYTRGKHVIRLGADFTRYQLNRGNRFATRGSVTFANTAAGAGGASVALGGFQNFLLGRVTGGQAGAGFSIFYFRAFDASSYIQDDWKISRRLTLNLGVRWEGLSVAHEKFNFLSNFRGLNDGTPGPIRIIHPAATPRVGTPGVSRCTLLNCFDDNNFGPRVGFAWDVFGDQRTVVRGGYGLYYQRVSNQPLLQTAGGLPFAQAVSPAAFSVTPANPFPAILPSSAFPLATDQVVPALVAFRDATGADPRGILATSATLAGAPIFLTANGAPLSGFLFFPERSFHAPKAQQWNLTVQRELFKGWILEVGYVGTKGTQLIGTGRPFNPGQVCTIAIPCRIGPEVGATVAVTPGTPGVTKNADGSILITDSTEVNLNARVPEQYLGLANSRGFFQGQDGNSIYHSLQTSLNHQWANGLYLQAAYTWSKTIDNGSGSAFGDELNGLLHYGNLLDQRANRGPSDFDRTHRLIVSYNYELPFAKLLKAPKTGWGRIVQGWAVNGVTTLQSGNPITVWDSSALLLQDTEAQNATNKALLVSGNPLTSGDIHGRLGGYFNLAAFTVGGQCVTTQNVPVAQTDPLCSGFAAEGNVGRNAYRGPFQQNWDMSLTKNTRITERVSVDFRAEFFNIWNHPSFNSPGVAGLGTATGNLGLVDVSSGDSSIVSTVNRPRIIQFALKVNF